MTGISELLDLSGRVALVTGGAGHIGREIVHTLAGLGADVAVVDKHESRDVVADVSSSGGRAFSIVADLEDPDAARGAVRDALSTAERLDILVHNAAYVGTTQSDGWAVPFPEQSVEAWRRALDVNLTAAFVLAQEAAPALRSSGNGVILNVGSVHGVVAPDPSMYEGTTMVSPAGYAVSKAGLLHLSRWLATHLAPEVRVNALSPGGIERGQPTVFRDRYRNRTPLKRMGTERDILGAVTFLCTDMSRYVTGQNLIVDGGWTVW